MFLIKEIDQCLLDLAWSLWTELGVRGQERKHQNWLIALEELIILTAILSPLDPRLRDESLGWCARYHHFISISRLKSLIKVYDTSICEALSQYAATLNTLSRAQWPVSHDVPPIPIILSHKSQLPPLQAPALFNLRARSLFGTGARADLITFLLTHENTLFSISDTVEIGYSKRNLAEILEGLWLSGLVDQVIVKNQKKYRLLNKESLLAILGPLPKQRPSWSHFLEVITALRTCLYKHQHASTSTQAVVLENLLTALSPKLKQMAIVPPCFEGNVARYLQACNTWIRHILSHLSKGDPSDLMRGTSYG